MLESEIDNEDTQDTLGGRLYKARESAGLTVAQAARRLGIQSKTWKLWENDQSEPRSNRLMMAAGVLGVSPSWLLMGQGEGPQDGPANEIASLRKELEAAMTDFESAYSKMKVIQERLDAFDSFNHVEPL